MRFAHLSAVISISAACLHAQVAFDVATIKPSAPQEFGRTSVHMSSNTETGRLNYTNVSPRDLLQQAYQVQSYQIIGPDWIDQDRFDIAAAFPPGADQSKSGRVSAMVQTLLADRFGLVIHRESKDMPEYSLAVAKNPPLLKLSPTSGDMSSNSSRTNWHLSAKSTMPKFADFLAKRMNRPVLDQTGLNDSYDFTLDWVPEDAPEGTLGPSIFTALQEQLGLRLTSIKGPVEMIVVDRGNRTPTEN